MCQHEIITFLYFLKLHFYTSHWCWTCLTLGPPMLNGVSVARWHSVWHFHWSRLHIWVPGQSVSSQILYISLTNRRERKVKTSGNWSDLPLQPLTVNLLAHGIQKTTYFALKQGSLNVNQDHDQLTVGFQDTDRFILTPLIFIDYFVTQTDNQSGSYSKGSPITTQSFSREKH